VPGRFRIGVVGTGWIGQDHLADLSTRDNIDVVAVCDVDAAVSQQTAAKYAALPYTDAGDMFASSPLDAVWVCTPPQFHVDPAVEAMRRGIPVYLEKPIARSLDEARQICEIAAQTNVVCAVGYQWHSLELLDTLRGELADQRVAALFGQSIGPTAARTWFLHQSEGGGNLLERGSHHLDLARTIGGEVAAILVVASSVRLQRGNGAEQALDADIDDALTIVLRYAHGATATISIAWSLEGAPSFYGLDVIAERGAYKIELDPAFVLTGRTNGHAVKAESTAAFRRSNDRFLEAVASGDPASVPCTPDDARGTLALALAGEHSLATGEWVDVS